MDRRFILALAAYLLFSSALFVFSEVALRIWYNDMLSVAPLDTPGEPLDSSDPAYDELLGYLPVPGERRHPDGWVATIDDERLRSPGRSPRPTGTPWLAVGDSFAFGDEVADQETWPSELERLTGRRVLNGGVYGYGLDQAVLRAERLMERHSPELVILSVISGDINRCENSYINERWKPYFDVVGGKLELFNTPVPTEPRATPWLRRWTGWSYAFRGLLRRVAPDWWYLGRFQNVHDRGDEVARLLMERLAGAADRDGARLLVVTLIDRDLGTSRLPALTLHLRDAGIPVLPLEDEIRSMARNRGVEAMFMPKRHLNPAMNRWVAGEIAAAIAPPPDPRARPTAPGRHRPAGSPRG